MAELAPISPNTTIPCRYASPDAPSMVNAVKFVPNRVINNTTDPMLRLATK